MTNDIICKEQLGMSYGRANSILKKKLLFSYAQKLGLDTCFRCGKQIANIDEFSVEHKIEWLYSDNPLELFLDLDNIACSHLVCNIRAGRRNRNKAMKTVNCKFCNKEFDVSMRMIKSKGSQGQVDFYCSHSCAGKHNNKGYGRKHPRNLIPLGG